eukprot:4135650-Amphidinium_carterae.1
MSEPAVLSRSTPSSAQPSLGLATEQQQQTSISVILLQWPGRPLRLQEKPAFGLSGSRSLLLMEVNATTGRSSFAEELEFAQRELSGERFRQACKAVSSFEGHDATTLVPERAQVRSVAFERSSCLNEELRQKSTRSPSRIVASSEKLTRS